jgi:hypothetical protein
MLMRLISLNRKEDTMKLLLIALLATTAANAKIVMGDQTKRPKNKPALYTSSINTEMSLAEATIKAVNGAVVYKCQEVVLTAGKASLSLKPVKEGQ